MNSKTNFLILDFSTSQNESRSNILEKLQKYSDEFGFVLAGHPGTWSDEWRENGLGFLLIEKGFPGDSSGLLGKLRKTWVNAWLTWEIGVLAKNFDQLIAIDNAMGVAVKAGKLAGVPVSHLNTESGNIDVLPVL